jgi:DeoR/GlpR family transcriptional regulator of sugar metabolism
MDWRFFVYRKSHDICHLKTIIKYLIVHEYLLETMTDRAILKAGNEIIVLADHTKFGRVAAVPLAPLVSIHHYCY